MFAIIFAAFLATAGHGCPELAVGGQLPQAAAADTIVCEGPYALGHSATLRSPIWSAEHMTPGSAKAALAAKRAGNFHPDPLIPASDQSRTADFHCSSFDRGHATPVGDFGDVASENSTFSMANMMIQDYRDNEGLHAGIENALLKAAAAGHEFYIVTGPTFGAAPGLLAARDAIPSTIWKAAYDVTTGSAAVYVEANDGSGHYTMMSDVDAAALIGFDPLPGAPAAAKATAGQLPAPTKGTQPGRPDRTCPAH